MTVSVFKTVNRETYEIKFICFTIHSISDDESNAYRKFLTDLKNTYIITHIGIIDDVTYIDYNFQLLTLIREHVPNIHGTYNISEYSYIVIVAEKICMPIRKVQKIRSYDMCNGNLIEIQINNNSHKYTNYEL